MPTIEADSRARKHNVGDIDFGFVIPVAEEPADEPEEPPASSPAPAPAPATRPTPNTSAKRKHLDRNASRLSPAPQLAAHRAASNDVYSIPDHTTEGGSVTHEALPTTTTTTNEDPDPDHPMADAPALAPSTTSTRHQPRPQRGPLSSVISATKRLSFDPPTSSPPTTRSQTQTHSKLPQSDPMAMDDDDDPETDTDMQMQVDLEEVTESPADAPGSGRRRPLRLGAGTPVVGSSTLLQKVLADLDGDGDGGEGEGMGGDSSPVERRVATRRAARRSAESASGTGGSRFEGEGSPLAAAGGSRSVRLSGRSSSVVAESEVGGERLGVVEEEEGMEEVEEVEEVEESTVLQPGEEEAEVQEEEEQEEAQEVGEKEAAQRLGRKRPRRSPRAPSPELGTGIAEESPALKRRRRREPASPAQQQQPAKKARGRPPARPQPPRQPSPEPQPQPQRRPQAQTQAKPKPTAKRQTKKKKQQANDGDAEAPTGSVPVTVQRFTKPRAASAAADGEDEPSTDLLNGEIPFTNRGGVNAVDVLSKLCEELIEAYMDKLEERGRAAEDAATRREQKTMYRTLEAFQEELRTRLLEHVSVTFVRVGWFWYEADGGLRRRLRWTRTTPSARGCARRRRRSLPCATRSCACARRESRWRCGWTRFAFGMRRIVRRRW